MHQLDVFVALGKVGILDLLLTPFLGNQIFKVVELVKIVLLELLLVLLLPQVVVKVLDLM